MSRIIEVTPRSVYGKTQFYPANSTAEAIAELAGTKTLTRATLSIAVCKLGIPLKINLAPLLDRSDPDDAAILKLQQQT